ncbi:hypothetical protein ACEPAF_8124 [Sanghuangporus sanghuang]
MVVQSLGLRTVPAEGNYTIRNADGSINRGGWTRNVRAIVDTGITRGLMDIAVVDTHEDKFLIGNDWLEQHKPTIDWTKGILRKGGKEIAFNGTARLRSIQLILAPRKLRKRRRWRRIPDYIPPEWDADDEKEEAWETRVYYHSDIETGQETEKEDVEEEPTIVPPDKGKERESAAPLVTFEEVMHKPPELSFAKQEGRWKFFWFGDKCRITKDDQNWHNFNSLEDADGAVYRTMVREMDKGAKHDELLDEYGGMYTARLQLIAIQGGLGITTSPTTSEDQARVREEIQAQMTIDAEGSDTSRRKKPSVPPKGGKPGHYAPDPLKMRRQKSGGSGTDSNPVIRSIRVEWTPPSVHEGHNDSTLAVQKQSVSFTTRSRGTSRSTSGRERRRTKATKRTRFGHLARSPPTRDRGVTRHKTPFKGRLVSRKVVHPKGRVVPLNWHRAEVSTPQSSSRLASGAQVRPRRPRFKNQTQGPAPTGKTNGKGNRFILNYAAMEQGLSQGQKRCRWRTPVDSVMQPPKVEEKVLERRAGSETEFKGILGSHKPATSGEAEDASRRGRSPKPPHWIRRLEHRQVASRRERLLKYNSIAQKYAQEKALDERMADSAGDKSLEEVLPKQIWEFRDRFDKDAAKRLPRSGQWDMKIELLPGAELPKPGPVYPLAPAEKRAVEEWIREDLKKGWIRVVGNRVPAEEKANTCAPVFVIAKKTIGKDGKPEYRIVIDYRGLNAVVIPDHQPMPLLHMLPDDLAHAKWFSTLDLRSGYNNIRIHPGHEKYAAFRTHMGVYQPMVMQFGLMNAPAVFQRAMNELFQDMIGQGILIYLDDIIVYAEMEQEHWDLLAEVLRRLREADFFCKPEKCYFGKKELDYLGFVVNQSGMQMDPYKVKAVQEWPDLSSKRDIRKFIGFANFYRKFIEGFAKIARPLTELMSGKKTFTWGERQQESFRKLKEAFTTAPMLVRPDHEKQFVLETDASNFAMGAVLSQLGDDEILHPIGYWSNTYRDAENNYPVMDKELLAIVKALSNWRHHLEGAKHEIRVVSDQANLRYFMGARKLSGRQARWATFLSRFRFRIEYRPGTKNSRADALSQRPDYEQGQEDQPEQVLLPPQLFRTSDLPMRTVRVFELTGGPELGEKIRDAYERSKEPAIGTFEEGYWWKDDKLVIPPDEEVKKEIVRQCHDAPASGHPGLQKTIDKLERRVWWPKMREWVEEYVRTCDVCQRTKARRGKTQPPLQPLQIATRPYDEITMDYVTGLPTTSKGNNAILVVVDRFSKMGTFIPTTVKANSKTTADLMINYVYSKVGTPKTVISDRGPQFASRFTEQVNQALGIETKLSTAYHPQTDGQTERVNQEMEQLLRCYSSLQQDDWDEHLPMAEFAYNSRSHSSTGKTPFELVYGFQPELGFKLPIRGTQDYVAMRKKNQEEATKALEKARDAMKRFADRHRGPIPSFEVGDKVMLDGRNLTLLVPTRKLGDRNLGPYQVIAKHGLVNYELDLPKELRIHPVFYAGLLIPYRERKDPAQRTRPPPEVIAGETEYEVEVIRDMRKRHGKWEYQVKWLGYPEEENTWEPVEGLRNAPEKLWEYHERNRWPDTIDLPSRKKIADIIDSTQRVIDIKKEDDEFLRTALGESVAQRVIRRRRYQSKTGIKQRDFGYPEWHKRHWRAAKRPFTRNKALPVRRWDLLEEKGDPSYKDWFWADSSDSECSEA